MNIKKPELSRPLHYVQLNLFLCCHQFQDVTFTDFYVCPHVRKGCIHVLYCVHISLPLQRSRGLVYLVSPLRMCNKGFSVYKIVEIEKMIQRGLLNNLCKCACVCVCESACTCNQRCTVHGPSSYRNIFHICHLDMMPEIM